MVRTVREYERAGVAGLHIEDQVAPKKCGHIAGKQVIPTREFAEKVRAAAEHRTDPDFVIIARTDARAVTSLDDAIERGNRYAEAGADVIFVEAPQSEEEIHRIAREVRAPLLANMVAGGRTPDGEGCPSWSGIGFKIVIFPAVCVGRGHPRHGARARPCSGGARPTGPEGPGTRRSTSLGRSASTGGRISSAGTRDRESRPAPRETSVRQTTRLRQLLAQGRRSSFPAATTRSARAILERRGLPRAST